MIDAGLPQAYMRAALVIPLISHIRCVSDHFDVAHQAIQKVLPSPSESLYMRQAARVGLALMAAQRRDTTTAKEQYAALLPGQGTMQGWQLVAIDRVLGLLGHTTGQPDNAAAHFENALGFCRKAGYRPELAWTCHDYAEMLASRKALGDKHMAATLIAEGVVIAQDLGMKPLAAKLAALEEQVRALAVEKPRYPDGLSEREVEVLRLIAAGKTNQEIADQLFISLNTVLRHVSNIFSKTGAANRAEAVAYASRRGLIT
jgi:DNA-binding CsgD family transcriptional regulator